MLNFAALPKTAVFSSEMRGGDYQNGITELPYGWNREANTSNW